MTCTDTAPTGFVAPAGVTGLTVNIQTGATVGSQQTSAGANPSFTNVRVNGTSTVNNAGTISSAAAQNRDNFGVNLAGDLSTLNNTGTIILTAPAGNTATRVYGAYSSAPGGSQYASTTVSNSGTISVIQNGNGRGQAIYTGENTTLFTINNTGLISATRGTTATATTSAVAGVDADDDTDRLVVNNAAAGRITGTGANTRALSGRAAQYEINNSGTISNTTAGEAAIATFALNAGNAGDATTVRAYNTVITNTATGVINGDVRNFDQDLQTATTVVNLRRSGTVTNAGTINGNLQFGNGNQVVNNTGRISGNVTFLDVATAGAVAGTVNTVNLGTGSSIGGNITARGLGTNNLNLSGTGTLTSNVTGFTSLTQTAGAWTIGNNSTQTISGNLTVAGGNLTLAAGTTQNVGGLIQVTGSGAQLTVNNTITDKAVNLSGSNTTLVNNGTLSGTGVAGRANSAATRVYGVLANSNTTAEFDNIRVVNNGTIAVTENGIGISRGIYAGENINSMFVTNAGTISATRSGTGAAAVAGIDSDDDVAALTVTNQAGARITGTGTGVRAIQGRAQNYTITNAGTISGPTGGDAISTFAAGGTRSYNTVLVNAATGVINGNVRNTDVDNQTAASTVVNRRSGSLTNAGTINGSLFFGGGNQTIVNTGRISGDLNFLDIATVGTVAGSVNRVTLGTGSSIGGNIAARGLGANALVLTGTGTLTSNVVGFATLAQADGSWTLASGSTQTFSGGANITGGRLEVDSTLNAKTGIGAAGTLAGVGRINGNLGNAGIVAPGSTASPYGVLTVAGNYAQSSTGTLAVNVDPAGASSKLQVTGFANLSGAVSLSAAPGTYTANSRYTVLTANSGVVGNFTSASATNLPFLLRPVASTDANNAYVTLAQQSFTGVAQTQNQRNAASGVDALLANNPAALTFLDNQSNQALAGILDRVAGQGYASVADPQLRAGRAFTDAVMGRAYAAIFEAGPTGFTLPPAVYAADLPTRGPVPEPRFIEATRGYGIWATGYGQVGSVDSTANAAGRHETIAGFAGGIDFHPGAGTVLGISAGYGSVDVSVNRTGERAHTDNAQVAVYGGITNGPAYAIATVGYAHADGRLNRSLAGLQVLQPGGASGSIGGDQFLSSAEAGYRYAYTPSVILTPFVGAQVSTFSQDRVTEGNGGLFNLNVAAKDFLSARTLVGGRLESTVDLGGRAVTLAIRAAYVHDFADVSRTIQSSFTLAPVVPFLVSGRALSRDRALVGVGIGTQLAPGWTGFVNYDAELASSDTIQGGRAGLRYSF
ncbi:autotransporter domain-containing protein [Methylobacterium haplocladii]|uniref:Serine protease n=1 Tax=Methylobacterium haplocladii TaxID=1176176 RepID=A0A512ISJ1_9HYPH|nr:autotransporter domain-containing protein [Methylobacterium haplocladii]GEP00682.1 serine protease [Methylobacterium haplocladii]GLS60480.1 serine protease [Methylobacterium haplocladii]